MFILALFALARCFTCSHAEWRFPFFLAPENSVGLVFVKSNEFINTQDILMREALATPLILAKLHYEGRGRPELGPFTLGNNMLLGANVNFINGSWYIIVNKTQHYENPRQRQYKFQVYIRSKGYFQQTGLSLKVSKTLEKTISIAYNPMPCKIEENDMKLSSNCYVTVINANGNNWRDKLVQVDHNEDFELVLMENVTKFAKRYNLRVKQPLDYDLRNIYTLDFQAYDASGQRAELRALLQVVKTTSSRPIWTTVPTTRTINEEESHYLQLEAVDDVTGLSDGICYDFNMQEMLPIEINKETGLMHIKPLNREELAADVITLETMAYKCQNTEAIKKQRLTLIVQDINDNLPELHMSPKHIKIKETTELTFPLDMLQVVDMDLGFNGSYELKLASGADLAVAAVFAIIPDRGYHVTNFSIVVRNATYLDYEDARWRTFDMQLIASELSEHNRSTSTTLSIELENRNDEWPTFNAKNMTISIAEDLPANATLVILKAADADEHDQVMHSLLSNYPGLAVEPIGGAVRTTLANAFDYEAAKLIVLTIQATDTLQTDAAEQLHTSYAMLYIEILDVNDETPILHLPEFGINVNENITSDEIITDEIVAVDQDTAAELQLRIDWSKCCATKAKKQLPIDDFQSAFILKTINSTLNRIQAQLQLTPGFEHVLDYEQVDQILLTIEVTDLNQRVNENSSSAELLIHVQDINDNAPAFRSGTLSTTKTVTEWAQLTTIVGRIEAYDLDGPGFNNITYELVPTGKRTAQGLLAINPYTGILTVTGTIECDVPRIYELHYKVIITDQVFTNVGYFDVDIIDVNNKSPQLNGSTELSVAIFENARSGYWVTHIEAYDLDRDAPHNVLRYTLGRSHGIEELEKLFAIEPFTGVLRVQLSGALVLDRDNGTTFYQLPIEVHDNYDLSTGVQAVANLLLISVNVRLLDVNDNAPVMPAKHKFMPEFLETAAINTYSDAVLTAVDIDDPATNNSLVGYRLKSIMPAKHNAPHVANYEALFGISNIPATRGRLVVLQSLSGYYGYWDLEIEAYDHGIPQQQSRAVYQLNVLTQNFNAPLIMYPTTGSTLLLCYQRRTSFAQLYAADCETPLPTLKAVFPNGANNRDVKFEVRGVAAELFAIMQINDTNAQLVLKTNVRVMPGTSYQVNIRATDSTGLYMEVHNVHLIFVVTSEIASYYTESLRLMPATGYTTDFDKEFAKPEKTTTDAANLSFSYGLL